MKKFLRLKEKDKERTSSSRRGNTSTNSVDDSIDHFDETNSIHSASTTNTTNSKSKSHIFSRIHHQKPQKNNASNLNKFESSKISNHQSSRASIHSSSSIHSNISKIIENTSNSIKNPHPYTHLNSKKYLASSKSRQQSRSNSIVNSIHSSSDNRETIQNLSHSPSISNSSSFKNHYTSFDNNDHSDILLNYSNNDSKPITHPNDSDLDYFSSNPIHNYIDNDLTDSNNDTFNTTNADLTEIVDDNIQSDQPLNINTSMISTSSTISTSIRPSPIRIHDSITTNNHHDSSKDSKQQKFDLNKDIGNSNDEGKTDTANIIENNPPIINNDAQKEGSLDPGNNSNNTSRNNQSENKHSEQELYLSPTSTNNFDSNDFGNNQINKEKSKQTISSHHSTNTNNTETTFSNNNNSNNINNINSHNLKNNTLNHYMNYKPKYTNFQISSLVNPIWDTTIQKSSWVNKIIDGSDARLYRIELKGSSLLIYKPSSELSFAKNLNVQSTANTSDTNVGMFINNDFVKSTASLKSPNENAEDELGHLNDESDENDSTQVIDETLNDTTQIVDPNTTSTQHNVKNNDSILLSKAIDEYSVRDKLNFDLLKTNNNKFDKSGNLLDIHAIEMNKRQSLQSSSQNKKHLPFIVHDLYYQSPSCPHPKLVFDMSSGLILKGTLEAVCHTILFYPSDRMAEKLIEILPLIGSLIDPLVYFTRFLDHFSDSSNLKKKDIKISDMELQIMYTRLQKIIETTIDKFYGSLLDDEIFELLMKLTSSLTKKSSKFISVDKMSQLSNKLQKQYALLNRLVRFQVNDDPSIPFEQSDLISGHNFIMLSTETLANEIHAIDSHFMKYWSPRSDRSLIFLRLETVESSLHYWRYNPLQFIPPIHTHYLGRLLAYHLFEDPTTSTSASKRALILMKWIHLGSILCEQGDMVSWLGIAILICSQPVLRLSETWGHVDKNSIQIINKKWAPVVFEIRKNELFGSKYPVDKKDSSDSNQTDTDSRNIRIMITNRVGEIYAKEDAIPYFGELFMSDISTKNDNQKLGLFETDFIKSYCTYLETVDWNLKQWDEYYSQISNQPGISSKFECSTTSNDPAIIDGCEDAEISAILKSAIAYNSSNGPFPIDYFMSLSVSIEPPYVGQFARFHGTSRSPLFLGTYASILFPEILPHYEIYNREELIGAIGGAGLIGANDPEKKYKNRNVFLKRVRDLFNLSNDEFKLLDNTIIFKKIEYDNNKQSNEECQEHNDDANKKSRPSSVLFETPNHSKHLSTLSTGSFNLDDYINTYQSYLKDVINDSNVSITSSSSEIFSDSDHDDHEIVKKDTSFNNKKIDIVTTAATTGRLIDLLVLTASLFGTLIKTTDLQKYSEKTSIELPILLQMDNAEFTNTFFATYRVFCTTKQLIDSLSRRFAGSKSAALSIAKFVNSKEDINENSIFPNWDNHVDDDDETWRRINWKFVVQIQLGVIEATLILVSDYFKHFMDDIVTKATFDTFLEMMDVTIVSEWPKIFSWLKQHESSENVHDIIKVYKSLQKAYKQVRNICIRKSYTPQCERVRLNFSNEIDQIPVDVNLPISDDFNEIIVYVTKLDETISASMSSIKADNWIDTFEIIQMLISRSQLSMFNYDYQDSTTHSELIIISNIYHWILTLSDNDNFKMSSNSKIIKKLSPTIESIFVLYQRIQIFILSQIIDSSITLEDRVIRMQTLLKIIQICRIKMRNVELFQEDTDKSSSSPYVPSFIESVIVNTIMLPESRFYSHAWKLAVNMNEGENVSLDNLELMLPKLTEYQINSIQNSGSLSICPGWIVGRIVEIACFVPNMDVENTLLVNFDKNRFIHHCILKICGLQHKLKKNISPYSTRFSFLFEYDGIIPDLKSIYNHSSEERSKQKLTKCSIFKSHIEEQVQLLKLEERKRNLLIKQRHNNDMNLMKATSNIHKYTANITEPLPSLDKDDNVSVADSYNHSSFMETSSMIDYDTTASFIDTSSTTAVNTLDPNISSNSMSVLPSNQSIHSNATMSSTTSTIHNRASKNSSLRSNKLPPSSSSSNASNKFKFGFFKSRPFSLNIANNFNQQPTSERRSVQINELPNAENIAANLANSKTKPYITIMLKDVSIIPTYRTPHSFSVACHNSNGHIEHTFQTTTQDEASEWIYKLSFTKKHWFYSKSLNKQYANGNAKLTFGAPLDFVCERENTNIPTIIEKIFSEIELRGLEEVGIYRKSASLTVVQKIKDEVNKYGDFNMENALVFDIHNLTGCIKAYLRELPAPLINDELVEAISKVREVSSEDSRFGVYKNVLSRLPIYNYYLIKRLSRHMKLIEDYKSQNRMTSYNLATIMGGSLVEGCRPDTMRKAFGLMNFVCEDWILHYEKVFTD